MAKTRKFHIHTLRHRPSGRELKVRADRNGALTALSGFEADLAWSDAAVQAVRAAIEGEPSEFDLMRTGAGITLS